VTALSDAELANLAAAAGFDGEARALAVAIALAETGGKPTSDIEGDVALETATWGPSVGPWQIRSLKAERGTGGVRDELALKDPAHNAASAHTIYVQAGNSFRPWTTFVTGAFMFYRLRANAVTLNSGGPVTNTDLGPVTGVANAAETAASGVKAGITTIQHVGAWIGDPHNWARVAWVVLGGGLVVGALVVIAEPDVAKATKIVGSAAGAVSKVPK